MTSPRILLAHRCVARVLDLAGVQLQLPDVDAGRLEQAPAWLDAGPVEGVWLLLNGMRAATVLLDPPARPRAVVVTLHVAHLAPAGDQPGDLVADVVVPAALLDDLGFGP